MKNQLRSFAMLIAICFSHSNAQAQDTHVWNDPAGGVWGTFTKWTPAGFPSSLDTARFNLNADYTVSLIQGRQARLLQVLDGDVIFESSGILGGDRTLALVDALINNNGEVIVRRGADDRGMTLSTSDDMTVRGSLSVSGGAQLINISAVVDSAASNGRGQVIITGASSGGERSNWAATSLDVGTTDFGTVRVEDGGFVQINGPTILGDQSGSDGELEVIGKTPGGTASDFRSTGTIIIGKSGSGHLRVEDGAFAATGGAILGEQVDGRGTATIAGSTPGNAAFWIAGNLNIERGDVVVDSGGSMRTFGASIGTSDTSSITVSGVGSGSSLGLWEAQGITQISNSANATLDIEHGGTVNAIDVSVGTVAGGVGRINVSSTLLEPESRFLQSGDLYLGGDEFGAGGVGHLNLNTSSFARITGTTKIYEDSSIVMGPNSKLVAPTIENNDGGFFDFLRGTLHTRSYAGNLVNQEGTLAPYNSNSLSGEGEGVTEINGDYTQQSGATLAIEIADLGCGIGYDHLLVTGDATLGGDLQLTLIDDFVPNPLNNFTIVAADNLSGQFDNISPGDRLTTTDGLGSFVVNYGVTSPFHADNVILTGFQLADGYPGDFDFDEDVDGHDFLTWQRTDGSPGGLAAWQNNYGTTAPAISTLTSAVPEPATLLLVGLSVVSLSFVRRR